MSLKKGVEPINLGNGKWKIRVSCGYDGSGKKMMISKTINIDPHKTEKAQRAEACRYRDKLRIEYEEGKLTHSDAVTLKAYANQWLKTYCEEKKLAPGTISGYKAMLDKRAIPRMGKLRMRDVRPNDVKRFMASLRDEGLSGTTRRKYHNMLHLIFKTAVREQLISVNPLDCIEPPAKDTPEKRALDQDEARMLANALEGAPAKWRACILLLLDSSMRRGECLGLDWKDVDLKNRKVRIRQTWAFAQGYGFHLKEPKTKQSRRTIFINEQTAQALQLWKAEQAKMRLAIGAQWEDSGAVFTQENGKRMHLDSPATWFKNFLERNDLVKINLHGLRHTGASLLISQGADIVSVSRRLGHGDVSTTLNTYSHEYEEGQRNASGKMGHILYGNSG